MIIYENDSLGRSIVEIIIKNAGSISSEEGVAYFLSHILNTKGTISKKEKIYSIIENDAIEFHTSVNKEFFTLSIKFLNEKENKALQFLYEILTNPNLSEKAFEKSKNEIKAKIQNKKNDHDYTAGVNLYRAIFKNTPLMYPVMGENIEHISLEKIKTFYNSLFQKSAVIINGGKKSNLQSFESLFKHSEEQNRLYRPVKHTEIKTYKNVEQSYIHFASPFDTDYNSELYLAKISTFILGSGGFGSRLMEEIRVKRGYAYSAYSSNVFRKTYKLLSGYLQTKLENTQDAINIVKQLIEEFHSKGITEEELKQAKQFITGSEPLRNETLSQRLLRKFNEHYLNLPEGYYEKELELIKNATLDEVNSFICSHPEIKDLTFSIVTKE